MLRRTSQVGRAALAVLMLIMMLAPIPYVRRDVDTSSWDLYVGPDYHPSHDPVAPTIAHQTFTFHDLLAKQPAQQWMYAIPAVVLALVGWELAERRARRRIGALRLAILLATLALVMIADFQLDIFGEEHDLTGAHVVNLCVFGFIVFQLLAIARDRAPAPEPR